MKRLLAVALTALAAPALAETPAPDWFRAIDRDKDGVITLDELHGARYVRFARADEDRNGRLTPRELRTDRAWLSQFAWFDGNRDGTISIDEFETKGQARFRLLDVDADGRISLHEALSVAKAANNQARRTPG